MPYRKEQTPPPAEIAARAIDSRDGILIGELLKQIAFSTAPQEERSEALQRVAMHHAHMTHIVVGVLSTLSIADPVAAKRVAHAVLSERLDRERDIIYAAAARTLVELQPLDNNDLTMVARCVSSSLDAVRSETIRAIDNLPHFVVATVADSARAAEQTPAMQTLIRQLERRNVLQKSSLPPLPKKAPVISTEIAQPVTTAVDEIHPFHLSAPQHENTLTPTVDEPSEVPIGQERTLRRQTSSSLTAEQRCLLVPYRVPEIKRISDGELADAASQEKEPEKLFQLLCEMTLRNGRQILKTHMSKLVWLSSTPFSIGNRDIRILTDVLFAEEKKSC
jgi:hypothetical protein